MNIWKDKCSHHPRKHLSENKSVAKTVKENHILQWHYVLIFFALSNIVAYYECSKFKMVVLRMFSHKIVITTSKVLVADNHCLHTYDILMMLHLKPFTHFFATELNLMAFKLFRHIILENIRSGWRHSHNLHSQTQEWKQSPAYCIRYSVFIFFMQAIFHLGK